MPETSKGAAEWRRYWYLPIVAAMGYSTSSLHSYGLGAFVEPIEADLGWSRAQISAGLTIAGLTGAVFSIPLGMLVDRFGPRRVGLIGLFLMISAFGLLGTATGSFANWLMLWTFVAFANLFTAATIWTKAVASRFEHSRGLAFAITLAGASLTATLSPLIATALIVEFGWRAGFMGTAGLWGMVVIPMVALFFRSEQEDRQAAADPASEPLAIELPGVDVADAVRSLTFYLMVLVSVFFAFTVVGTTVHLIPILIDRGAEPLAAAGIASLVGIFSVVGRVGTGFLLDRLPANLLGGAICLLPVASSLLLLVAGTSPANQMASAILLGLTVGGEIDVIAYLTTRKFGLKRYGVIFGAMLAGMNVGTATGALLAGAIHDQTGSYAAFLVVTMTAMGISSLALVSMGKPRLVRL